MGRATVPAGLATMAYKASASTSVASVVRSWLNPRTADSLFPVGPIPLLIRDPAFFSLSSLGNANSMDIQALFQVLALKSL